MGMNMFKAKTKEEATQAIIDKASSLNELKELEQLGKDILSDARYTKYRDKFEKLLGQVIRNLLNYNHPDNNVYAVNVRTVIQQLKDLLAFINTPVNFLNHVVVQRINLSEGNRKEDIKK